MVHHMGSGIVAFAIIFGAVAYSRAEDANRGLTSSAYMHDGIEACANVHDSERYMELLLAHDYDAANAFAEPREEIGICRKIEEQTHIAVEQKDRNWFCVRPYGDPTCYWALNYAVYDLR